MYPAYKTADQKTRMEAKVHASLCPLKFPKKDFHETQYNEPFPYQSSTAWI